jgi:hypothetical protein
MQAIFFCNISLQKKTKNKRANAKNKEQELNMAMDQNFKLNDQTGASNPSMSAKSIIRNL